MVNRQNYHLTKEYLAYLAEVSQLDPRSVERYWFYLKYLLLWADEVLLGKVTNLRPTFSSFPATIRLDGEQGMLSPSTLKKIIQTVKRFLTWLKMTYPREFRDMSVAWIEALRPPRSVEQMAEHVFVTLAEALQISALKIDEGDLALRRDQAAAAMLFLSGMRASAFGSMPISAVDLPSRSIEQWPSLGVKTKNGKSATTYLLDIPELLSMVVRWDAIVRAQTAIDGHVVCAGRESVGRALALRRSARPEPRSGCCQAHAISIQGGRSAIQITPQVSSRPRSLCITACQDDGRLQGRKHESDARRYSRD